MKKLEKQIKKAEAAGYKYVASVVKSHYNTTYYHVVPIETLIISKKWIPALKGNIGINGAHGRIGQSQLPQNTILRQALYNL